MSVFGYDASPPATFFAVELSHRNAQNSQSKTARQAWPFQIKFLSPEEVYLLAVGSGTGVSASVRR